MADEVLETKVGNAIKRAGWSVGKIVRIYPPLDTGGEMEVLFMGEERSAPIDERSPRTAYIRDVGGAGDGLAASVADDW